MKFGGSSLESASAIEQAAAIVRQHLDRNPIVVVSAMGKTTDALLSAVQAAKRGDSYSSMGQAEAIRRTHVAVVREALGQRAEPFLRDSVMPLIRELQVMLVELKEGRVFTPQVQDQALSYGERLSSLIVAEVLRHTGIRAAQVDARKVVMTDDQFTHASPLYWDTYERLRRSVALVARSRVVVMGGFIGATLSGQTTTLGRGGSDLTASLVGAGLAAEEIQIWSDVDGLLSCDPRVLAGGYRVRQVSYEEAQEMARFGAKVLFSRSIEPAMRQSIPIVVRNARQPENPGTRVDAKAQTAGIVKGVTCKCGMAVVHLRARNRGLLSSITDALADLFARERVSIDLIQAREQGISFAVENWPGLARVLRRVDESVEIEVEEDRASIWVAGNGIAQSDDVRSRATEALRGVNVRLRQESSSLTLGFAVAENDLRIAVQALHREFFAEPDQEIFAAPSFARRAGRQADLTVAVRPAGSQVVLAH